MNPVNHKGFHQGWHTETQTERQRDRQTHTHTHTHTHKHTHTHAHTQTHTHTHTYAHSWSVIWMTQVCFKGRFEWRSKPAFLENLLTCVRVYYPCTWRTDKRNHAQMCVCVLCFFFFFFFTHCCIIITFKKNFVFVQFRARGLPDDHEGPVRVLDIEGIDATLCCGTHVSNLAHLQVRRSRRTCQGGEH